MARILFGDAIRTKSKIKKRRRGGGIHCPIELLLFPREDGRRRMDKVGINLYKVVFYLLLFMNEYLFVCVLRIFFFFFFLCCWDDER